jgi:hypothetical protein
MEMEDNATVLAIIALLGSVGFALCAHAGTVRQGVGAFLLMAGLWLIFAGLATTIDRPGCALALIAGGVAAVLYGRGSWDERSS